MAISGNPKMLAYDIAKGFFQVNVAILKTYTPEDLKTVLVNISIVQRELRAEQVPLEDSAAIKGKNQRLQRLQQAVTLINSFAKQHRLRL
jgi:hypothetical protein